MAAKWIKLTIGSLCGALFLSFLSLLQKMLIGACISPDGFLIPVLFGGFAGFVIALWGMRLLDSNRKLKSMNLEKEVLLKELHHRVKNNLQIISSIINLSRSSLDYLSPEEVLEHVHERITIITRIQEDIFDHISEERLPVGGLITSLAGYLELNCSDRRIRFKVQAEPLVCRSCGLVPFGLLLYEMVSNTVRHAFPENRKGADSSDPEIEIAFFRKSDDSIVLSVSDNGCGFPFQGDPLERKSLGMSMIKALAEQLDGTVELKGTEGVSWTVTFPCSELNVTVF